MKGKYMWCWYWCAYHVLLLLLLCDGNQQKKQTHQKPPFLLNTPTTNHSQFFLINHQLCLNSSHGFSIETQIRNQGREGKWERKKNKKMVRREWEKAIPVNCDDVRWGGEVQFLVMGAWCRGSFKRVVVKQLNRFTVLNPSGGSLHANWKLFGKRDRGVHAKVPLPWPCSCLPVSFSSLHIINIFFCREFDK